MVFFKCLSYNQFSQKMLKNEKEYVDFVHGIKRIGAETQFKIFLSQECQVSKNIRKGEKEL
ncbi:hypothetical protein H9X84_04075 [Anaerotignum lactatifermentans]|nr:hypothetical protein [Anaerotignum lactatifermentans]